MALFKIKRGLAANLPTTYVEGYCYVTTDDGKFYIDTSNAASGRIVLNAAHADDAGKWTNARTITLKGDASGSVSLDGSKNVDLTVTIANDSHTHNTQYLKLSGGTLTGDLNLLTQNNDRFINWTYQTSGYGASFRMGVLGTGSDNSNYFVIQSTGSGTSSTEMTYNNTMRIGMNNKDVTFYGAVTMPSIKLNTARTFTTNLASTTAGSFDGSANVTVGVNGTLPVTNGGTGTATKPTQGGIIYASSATAYASTAAGSSGQLLQSAGTGKPTWITATNSNTASTVVKRDGNGNFSAGTITATLSGNASTASKWATARNLTIGAKAKSVDGSTNVSWSWNEIGVQRSKALIFTGTAYRTFVIPLCELTNTNASADFFFRGSIYVKRNNILSDWLTRLDIECGKQYNTTDPMYHITIHGGAGTKWTPVTFTYNSIKYFGVKCVVTGAGYEGSTNCYAAGYATNWDIIEYTPIYNNNTSAVINEEIYNSLVELSGTTNVTPMIAFHDIRPRETEVFSLGADTYKWNAVYAKTLYGNGANITGLNASNINAGTLAAARLPASGVTAGTYGLDAAASPAHGGKFLVPKIVVDTTGRITAAGEYNITLPSLSLITAASATATANAAATSGNVYLNLVSNNAILNSHRLLCSGPLNITCDANGNITFANTAYTKSQVDTNITAAINNLVNAAPGALDTLDELAAALGDDANFATTVTNLIGTKQATITGAATTITSSNLTANRALISNGNGKVAVSAVTSTELSYLDGVTSSIQNQLNMKTPYATRSKATAATAGWYRIATTAASISNCNGLFQIVGAISGYHTTATIMAGTSYGVNASSNISVLQCAQYSGNALTKVRIVYHTSYSGNYAYLEVYNPNAKAITITVKMIGGNGWSLVDPNTAGSIPSGYSNKEVTLVNGTIYSEKFSGNGASLTGLSAANISAGTLPVAYGGTGKATLTSGEALIGAGTDAVTTRGINNMTTKSYIAHDTKLMTTNTLAYWNGAYASGGQSNLTYCNRGAFGNVVTKSYTDSSSASAISTGTSVPTERDIYYGLPTINNSHSYTSATTIYAPSAGGTAGQYLKAAGATSTPTWASFGNLTLKTTNTAGTTATIGTYNSSAAGTLTVTAENLLPTYTSTHTSSLSANQWTTVTTPKGANNEEMENGTYIIQVSTNAGEFFSGVMSWTKTTTVYSTIQYDEVVMHNAGTNKGFTHIGVRVYRDATTPKLQLCAIGDSSVSASTSSPITIKMRRMI